MGIEEGKETQVIAQKIFLTKITQENIPNIKKDVYKSTRNTTNIKEKGSEKKLPHNTQ